MGVFWWIPAMIPLIGALILLVCPAWPISRLEGAKSSDEIRRNWGKFGIYLTVNILVSMLFAGGSWARAVSKMKFSEVWNMKAVSIRYEMEWTTEERHTREVANGTYQDSDGNTHTSYRTEVYYTTEHHGPYWYRIDEYGNKKNIGQGEYDRWKGIWKTEKQTGIHKGSATLWDRVIDGPIFECLWPSTLETLYPLTSIHTYVNKIRVSHSVLKWGEATPEQLAKYPRPVDKGNTSPVIPYGGFGVSEPDLLFLQRINASFGRKYEIHAMLVLFGKDVGRNVVMDVLTAWQGPNKNELVTFVSLDGQTVRWVEVHSWMDNTTLHATLRDELAGQDFTVKRYGELLQRYVPTLWHRKHFTPLNEYLRVDIHPGWLWLAVILSILFWSGIVLGD